MSDFEVLIRATSLLVRPGSLAVEKLEPLLNLLTYEDEYVEETKTLGYIYDDDNDILYLHKGVDLNYLQKLLGSVKFISDEPSDGRDMEFEYDEIIPPRNDEQVDVINFVAGLNHHADNVKANQLFLVLGTGKGKTFCSCVGLSKYHKKTLIIMHRDQLRGQWTKTLMNMIGMEPYRIHEIKDTSEIYAIAKNKHDFDYDVYLMTHATFRAGIKRLDSFEEIGNIIKNLGIGLKIVDEAHLEFRDTLIMDFAFNCKRNLYLTATDGRSSKDENAIFKHVFTHAVYYKPSALLTTGIPNKWVEYTTVEINTHCKPNIYRYRVNGGRGMNPASYGKWVIQYDKNKTHFRVCEELLRIIFERDKNAKVLIFMPLIDLCSDCAFYLNKKLNYDPNFPYNVEFSTINSKNTKAENERNKRADVIITTIASCGTGTDLPGMTDIICCSPYVSKITAEQVHGRLRYCGKICHYYDIFDSSVKMDQFWMKSRSKKLSQLSLNVKHIRWSEEEA